MAEDVVPEQLRPAMSRFQDALGSLRTTRIRASQLTVPPMPVPDPALLEHAATRPDAPAQLRALARAVADGRTSWAEALSGHGLDVPEIRDLVAASGPRMAEKLAEAENAGPDAATAAEHGAAEHGAAEHGAAGQAPGTAAPPGTTATAATAGPPVPPRRGTAWDDDDLGDESYLY